jgi:hypothetical protein
LFRFLLPFVFTLLIVVPVFSQTGQDTTIKLPDTVHLADTTTHVVRPVTVKVLPAQVKDSSAPHITNTIDTAAIADTVVRVINSPMRDSISYKPFFSTEGWVYNDSIPLTIQILRHHPYYNFTSVPVIIHESVRKFQGKETMFYALAGFLLFFALIREGFGKYFSDMFRVFFQSSLKQRQIREQLMQSPLPSLVFNIFFVASAGLYLDFMLQYFRITPVSNFWLLYLYCCIGLAVIYLVKFIGLKLIGWLFKMNRAADSYIFIVFSVNKVIGVFLLPFPILLAFSTDPMYTIARVVSWCGIGALLLYRFILGFAAIRNEVRFNLFHFFLYLCAFEIAPLLLIYKLLLLIF